MAIGHYPTKPHKNFKDFMSMPYPEEWKQAYDEEFQGFIDREAFVPVYPHHGEKNQKILETTTRTEYKSKGGRFVK